MGVGGGGGGDGEMGWCGRTLQWPAGGRFSRPEADLPVRGRIQPAEGGSGRPRPDRAGRGRPGAGQRAGRGPAEGRKGEPHQKYKNRLWAQTLIFLRENYRLLRKADFLTGTPNVDDGESGYPVGALCQGGPRTRRTPHGGGSSPSCPFGRATPPSLQHLYLHFT